MDIESIRTDLEATVKNINADIVKLTEGRTQINVEIKAFRVELAETERFLKATKPRATKKAKTKDVLATGI